MRFAWILLLAACAATDRPDESGTLLRRANAAARAGDWTAALEALEQASLAEPDDVRVTLRLAETALRAFGDVVRAENLYESLDDEFRARKLHGVGLCALWRGEEERALELWRASIRERPTTAAARDLAARLLARGEPADDALDLVETLSGDTLRSRLLLAAAGRLPAPDRLPATRDFGVERARLLGPGMARREIEEYVEWATATSAAKKAYLAVLEGDLALKRNPEDRREVKEAASKQAEAGGDS